MNNKLDQNERKVYYYAYISINKFETLKRIDAKTKGEAINIAKEVAKFTNGKVIRVGKRTEIIKFETLYEEQ